MMALALAALLSFQDPAGDTVGNGTLTPPTAAVFRNLGSFDLLGVEVLDAPTLQLALTFAALPNPLELPNGFSLPIVELYIGDATAGSPELLPGSGMALPQGATWHYALRLTGDRAQVFVAADGAVAEGVVTEGVVTPEGAAGAGAETEGAAPGSVTGTVSVTDTVITVRTTQPRPESPVLYGLVGGYSPFSDSGWQGLSAAPSPWAFSSTAQNVPVVDVLADDEAAQVRAIDTRTLPGLRRATPPPPPRANPWLLLVAGGFVVALVGLVGRFTVPKPGLPPEYARADAPTSDQPGDPATESATLPPPLEPASAAPDVDIPVAGASVAGVYVSGVAIPEVSEAPSADPEDADLEAWVASEPPPPAASAREHVPTLPETYPPGTGSAVAESTQLDPDPLKFDREDWLEPGDADLWAGAAQGENDAEADDRVGVDASTGTDVKPL